MSSFFVIFLILELLKEKGDLFSLNLPLYIEERKNLYGPHGDFINRLSNFETAGTISNENVIFFVLQNGEIYQYYAAKFKKIISLESRVICPPKLYNDVLYIGTASGELVAISTKSHEILWKQKLFNKPIISPPVIAEGFIILKFYNDDLLMIDTKNGETKKIIKSEESPGYKVITFSPPIYDENERMIFYGTQTGDLNAVDLDFKILWKIKLKEGYTSFTGTPVIGDGIVAIPLGGKYIVGVNKKTGEKLWEEEMKNIGVIGNYNGEIFVVSQDGVFTSIDINNGKKIKEKKIGIKGANEISISGDGKIIVGTSTGNLYILNRDFKILQGIKLEGGISSPISIYPRGVGVLTDTGNAYVFVSEDYDR
jgi:outer membrane protein assembly factor BamB